MSCIAICSICEDTYTAAEKTEDGVCIRCLLEACDRGPEADDKPDMTDAMEGRV